MEKRTDSRPSRPHMAPNRVIFLGPLGWVEPTAMNYRPIIEMSIAGILVYALLFAALYLSSLTRH